MADNAFDLLRTYVRFDEGRSATRIEVSETFWSDVVAGKRHDLDQGVLVAAFAYDSDWPSAEMHPEGDEIVYLVSGAIDLVLQHGERDEAIALEAGEAVIVPRGTWHTARVRVPGHALHITPGAGTEHRPVDHARRS